MHPETTAGTSLWFPMVHPGITAADIIIVSHGAPWDYYRMALRFPVVHPGTAAGHHYGFPWCTLGLLQKTFKELIAMPSRLFQKIKRSVTLIPKTVKEMIKKIIGKFPWWTETKSEWNTWNWVQQHHETCVLLESSSVEVTTNTFLEESMIGSSKTLCCSSSPM